MRFITVNQIVPFLWSRMDVISPSITFEMLMIKIRHSDKSWAK